MAALLTNEAVKAGIEAMPVESAKQLANHVAMQMAEWKDAARLSESDKGNALLIIMHYRLSHQIRKFAEESFELIEALLADMKNSEHVLEEIADCYILLEQFKQLFCFSEAEISNAMRSKIERQIERIRNEKENE